MGDFPTKEEQEAEHAAKSSAREQEIDLHNAMRRSTSQEERDALLGKTSSEE